MLLYCTVEPGEGCVSGSVRLAGGVTNSSSGRVEVCVSGVWGSVCDRAGGWQRSSNNAAIICRQLGLPTDGQKSCITYLVVLYLRTHNNIAKGSFLFPRLFAWCIPTSPFIQLNGFYP